MEKWFKQKMRQLNKYNINDGTNNEDVYSEINIEDEKVQPSKDRKMPREIGNLQTSYDNAEGLFQKYNGDDQEMQQAFSGFALALKIVEKAVEKFEV